MTKKKGGSCLLGLRWRRASAAGGSIVRTTSSNKVFRVTVQPGRGKETSAIDDLHEQIYHGLSSRPSDLWTHGREHRMRMHLGGWPPVPKSPLSTSNISLKVTGGEKETTLDKQVDSAQSQECIY